MELARLLRCRFRNALKSNLPKVSIIPRPITKQRSMLFEGELSGIKLVLDDVIRSG
jgi:hypothetical protein